MAQPIDDKQQTVTFRAVSHDEEGRKRVERVEVDTHNVHALRHIEKKLVDKGVHRKDRQPNDGLPRGRVAKSGHGGKYTWEGPGDDMANEMEDAPAALDENDPNYVDEEAEERILRGEVSGVTAGMVVGEVEVAKLAEEGVARVDVDPKLQPNV
ncbi:hypothetical protein BUALT_Bualt11G0102200 [Buddleja alternifolia]|uniref:Uncharacterized protein n=1 Tax=Buddleja alternifolia TaxID=168488 RepID=A0AAV6X2I1_9LAMI|nr:hypothetical protein BUALT_Bualt11G0102200 [Buddleja alternifolia]